MKFLRLKHQLIEPLCQCSIMLLCIIMEDRKQMFKSDLRTISRQHSSQSLFFLSVGIQHKI